MELERLGLLTLLVAILNHEHFTPSFRAARVFRGSLVLSCQKRDLKDSAPLGVYQGTVRRWCPDFQLYEYEPLIGDLPFTTHMILLG